MEAAIQQEGIEGLCSLAAGLTREGIVVEETETGLFIGLEDAPGKQGAHVQLAGPGVLQQGSRQGMPEFGDGQSLGLGFKVHLVLKRRQAPEHRHDPIKGTETAFLVGAQSLIGLAVAQGMQTIGGCHRNRSAGCTGTEGWGQR